MQHGIPETTQVTVPTRVSRNATTVITAINFHDEPHRRSHKVRNVATYRYLTAEGNAEAICPQFAPECDL